MSTQGKAAKGREGTARSIIATTKEDRRYIRRLRKLGASNYEIAAALSIPEDAPVLQEH